MQNRWCQAQVHMLPRMLPLRLQSHLQALQTRFQQLVGADSRPSEVRTQVGMAVLLLQRQGKMVCEAPASEVHRKASLM